MRSVKIFIASSAHTPINAHPTRFNMHKIKTAKDEAYSSKSTQKLNVSFWSTFGDICFGVWIYLQLTDIDCYEGYG